MSLQMKKEGAADSLMIQSKLSELWKLNQVFDMKNSAEDGKIDLFQTDFYQQVLHQFLGSHPRGHERQGACPVEWSIVYLARLDACGTTLVQCLAERETRGGHLQKTYADMYGAVFCLTLDQLTEDICAIVKHWKPVNLVGTIAAGEAKLIQAPSSGLEYLNVDSRWFERYIFTELGEVNDCYIAKSWG